MEWLNENFPLLRKVDVDYTMRRYEFSDEVCEWIKTTWTKTSEENGGTYENPASLINRTAFYILNRDGVYAAEQHLLEATHGN